jgi:hypothetical protein
MIPTRILAGAVLILLGIAWLLQTSGLVQFDAYYFAPIALILIGAALAIGSPRGLHVPLFVAGIVLSVILAGNNAAERATSRNNDDVRAEQVEAPTSAADLHPYRLGAGSLTLDLTKLPRDPDETYRVEARVGAGRLLVYVPSGVDVRVEARSGAGNVNIFGRSSGGLGSNTTTRIEYPNRTRFRLELRSGVGSIIVRHRAPSSVSY